MALTLTGTSTSPLRTASAAPASLPASVVAANETRRREASAAYQEAMVSGEAQRSQIEANRNLASRNLAADYASQRFQGMQELAGIGQARSPRFADRFRREMLRRQTQQQAEQQRQAAQAASEIEMMIQAARRARDRQLLNIESEEALYRTALDRVFNPPSYGGA